MQHGLKHYWVYLFACFVFFFYFSFAILVHGNGANNGSVLPLHMVPKHES